MCQNVWFTLAHCSIAGKFMITFIDQRMAIIDSEIVKMNYLKLFFSEKMMILDGAKKFINCLKKKLFYCGNDINVNDH